nr:nucleotide-binding alpha-beta plait domain-containing protein [Tanacetum cinerariifolium]
MSYVNVVNGDTKSTEACEPALLLDESCLKQLDYSLGLLGKVKEFSSFYNMRMVLGNEGFNVIDLGYMGASKEFVIDERITWVDIEGIPLKLWSESKFNRIAPKWGKMLYLDKLDEGCLYNKRLRILTTGKSNILEIFKIIHKGKRFSVRAKETTRWIPDFDEQEEDNCESEDEQSIGFIKEDFDGSDVEKEGDNNVSMVPDSVKEDVNVQAEEKGNDFDVNNSLDPFELYPIVNKKKNVEEKKDKSNGMTKMEDISLIDVKCCWGNYAFDGVNLLIISVYAPQEYGEKKMLWDYLVHLISKWDGKVIVIGDFNEVRFKNERFGALFHAHGVDAFNRFILQANLQKIPLGDQGNATDDILYKRMEIIKDIQEQDNKAIFRTKRLSGRCGIDKSLGPDGVTFDFIRRYWSFIEKDVVAAVQHFLLPPSLSSSLRRMPRSGIESEQWDHLLDSLEGVMLNASEDRWSWDLNGSGEFSVASAR